MKIFKKIIFVLLAVCMAFSSFALSACVTPDKPVLPDDLGSPEKDGYQITVKYPDGSPVKGSDTNSSRIKVSLVLLNDSGERLTEPSMGIIDEFGVARIAYRVPGEYTVDIINIPDGYEYAPVKTSATASKLEINLTNLVTAYPVHLTYSDGSPAANIPVKLVDESKADKPVVASVTTGSDGKATSEKITAGVYSVNMELPETKGYLPVQTNMRGDTVEAEIFDINLIKFEDKDKLDDAGMNKWDRELNGIVTPFEMSADYFEYTAHATKSHPAYYAIYAEKRGTYKFHVWPQTEGDYQVKFYGESFESVFEDLTLVSDGNVNRPLDLDAGNVYYFAVATSDESLDLTFATSLPIPSPTTTEWMSETGTKTVEFEMNEARIKFRPQISGIYEITSVSDYDTLIKEYGNSDFPLGDDKMDDDSGEGKNFLYVTEIRDSYVGGTFNYRVYIKDENVEYPTSIQVSIRRIGDAREEKQYIKKNVNTSNTVTYENQNGTFTWMPLDGSLETYQKSNGNWYVKLSDGTERPLVIAITKNIRQMDYSFSTIEYMGDSSAKPETNPDGNGDNNVKTPVNDMLTVAEDLEKYLDPEEMTANLLNYRGFIETYSTLVNGDGVYELNNELKLFVERYMNQRGLDIANYSEPPLEIANGCMWLIACGYYA